MLGSWVVSERICLGDAVILVEPPQHLCLAVSGAVRGLFLLSPMRGAGVSTGNLAWAAHSLWALRSHASPVIGDSEFDRHVDAAIAVIKNISHLK